MKQVRRHTFSNVEICSIVHPEILKGVLEKKGFDLSKPIKEVPDHENEWVTYEQEVSMGGISDGYHTFDELYYHRMVLFVVICAQNKNRAWKSWKHDDGTMFDNYFIVGVETREGQYTYHYHKDHWWLFEVSELERAPKWDGHKPEDVTRLLSLPSDGGGDINQEGQN